MNRHLILLILLISSTAKGDTWKFPKEIVSHEYKFGNVKITSKQDGVRNQAYPVFSVEIYLDGDLQALYKGIYFDHIVSDKDNKVFVGISNKGIPGTAVVIFDSRGNIKLLREHNQRFFEYCSWSVTVDRTWYNYENPELKVVYDDDGVPISVQAIGCKGNIVDILKNIKRGV